MTEEYGIRGLHFTRQDNAPLDDGMDIPACVQHAFHVYDGLAGGIGNYPDIDREEDVEEILPEPEPVEREAPIAEEGASRCQGEQNR